MRPLNVLFAVCFLASAVLQYNDPDPIQWMGIYLTALGACVAWERGTPPRALFLGIALVALGWGVAIGTGIELGVPLGQALTDWGMKSQGSEEVRETGGLLIVTVWMVLLALFRRERARAPKVRTRR